MDNLIRGLHHVTATVAGAQQDLDFFAEPLGQRLVKRTVNFDNPHVYHLYYGNEEGTPGTLMTTFPYSGMGVRVGAHGAGQIGTTSFSVPADALGWWRARLANREIPFEGAQSPFGEETILLRDRSGLVVRLVGSERDERVPWVVPEVGADQAIRGLHGVTLVVRDPSRTVTFLTELLDGALLDEHAGLTRVGIGGSAPGQIVEVADGAAAPSAINGLGTVHHVAFAVENEEAQLRMRAVLVRRGHQVTEVLDRQYFRSIYFREPGGVLFEIATIPPGFMTDEPMAELGSSLKLPPWEEPNRRAIEAALTPVHRS